MTGMGGSRVVHTIGGPLVFLVMVAAPLPEIAYPIRASLGLLIWMSWWWIAQPVHLAVTGLLPLAVLAVFDFLPVLDVLPAYSQQLVILLIGANVLATLWTRWGLDRRIALVSLLGIGTSTRHQILAWFVIATVLSSFLPNTVVAAAMMPIVVAMLRFIDITEIDKSVFGSALLIAVAWGTSVGGSGTPVGGAPNLLTVQFIESELIDHEFLFTTWVTRIMPLTILTAVVAFIFMRIAFKPEMERVEGTHRYFTEELRKLGELRAPERWGLALFAVATLLSFTRQFYAEFLPGLTPAFAFLVCALVCFIVRHKGEALLTWEYAQGRMVWGLIYLFAGGSALGQILSQTGTAEFLAAQLTGFAVGGGGAAIVAFVVLTVALSQITSNTAAVAIVIPITISTFQSLGINPIPMVYIVAAAGNYGLVLPSSSGGCAVAAGYGVNLKMMSAWGLALTLLVMIVLIAGGYLLTTLWPGFGIA